MLHDRGPLSIYTLDNQSQPGRMPTGKLIHHSEHLYGERTIGYGRQYAAKGVAEQVDLLAEIWEERSIRIGMYATDESGDQYRIDNVQHTEDKYGVRITVLTLKRLEQLYDISE